jgi:hypothetical protein
MKTTKDLKTEGNAINYVVVESLQWATGRGHEDDERRLIHSTCLCVVLVSFPHETSSTTLDG